MQGIETEETLEAAFVAEWGERYGRAWNEHDGAALAGLCTEDVVWRDPSLPGPVRGREAVAGFLRDTVVAFPDFEVVDLESHYVSADGPRALGRYRMTGTMLGPWRAGGFAPTGARIEVHGVDEYTFRGELMCAYRSHYDGLDVARQLGIMPPAGSRAERAMVLAQHLGARVQRRRAGRG